MSKSKFRYRLFVRQGIDGFFGVWKSASRRGPLSPGRKPLLVTRPEDVVKQDFFFWWMNNRMKTADQFKVIPGRCPSS